MTSINRPTEIIGFMEVTSVLTRAILNLDKFVISSVHAFVAGTGFRIALASDFMIADNKT